MFKVEVFWTLTNVTMTNHFNIYFTPINWLTKEQWLNQLKNCTWIKDHLKVATNPISETLASQGVGFDDMEDFNDDGHKLACYTARNPGGGDKGVNVSPIKETILAISICTDKYYEYAGRSIEPNIMEWSRIKHFKYLIQIQDNWSDQ